MSHKPTIAWDQLEPLLQGGWIDARTAFDLLISFRDRWVRQVHAIWGKARARADHLGLTAEDLVHDVLVSIIDKAERGGGLTRPTDPASDALSWLVLVVKNAARSALRLSQAQGGVAFVTPEGKTWIKAPPHEPLDLPSPDGDGTFEHPGLRSLAADPSVERRLADHGQAVHLTGQIQALAKPHHAFAALATLRPSAVDRALCDRACASKRLPLPASTTWERFEAWRAKHLHSADTPLGKAHLAWCLFCDDEDALSEWQGRGCKASRLKVDLLRKWAGRAVASLGKVAQ